MSRSSEVGAVDGIQSVGQLTPVLHFTPGTPVHSDANSASLGTFHPLSITRYSFTKLNELGCHRENKDDQASKRWQKGLDPDSLD